jgi:hypothetical protein
MNKAEHRHEISRKQAIWLQANYPETIVLVDRPENRMIGTIKKMGADYDTSMRKIYVTQSTKDLIDRKYKSETTKSTEGEKPEDLFDCEINYLEAWWLLARFPDTKVKYYNGVLSGGVENIKISDVNIEAMFTRMPYSVAKAKVYVTSITKLIIDQARANGEIPEVLMPKESFETESDYKALYEKSHETSKGLAIKLQNAQRKLAEAEKEDNPETPPLGYSKTKISAKHLVGLEHLDFYYGKWQPCKVCKDGVIPLDFEGNAKDFVAFKNEDLDAIALKLETELTEKEKEIEDLQSALIGHHSKTRVLMSYYKDRKKLDYLISKMEEGLNEN